MHRELLAIPEKSLRTAMRPMPAMRQPSDNQNSTCTAQKDDDIGRTKRGAAGTLKCMHCPCRKSAQGCSADSGAQREYHRGREYSSCCSTQAR